MRHNLIFKINEKQQFVSSSVSQLVSRSFKLLNVIVFSLFIFSECNKEEFIPVISNKTIDFFGEKLILRSDLNIEDVNKYIKGQNAFYGKSKLNADNNNVLNLISNDIFYSFVNLSLKNYPVLKSNYLMKMIC
jgi:hypothetical protein